VAEEDTLVKLLVRNYRKYGDTKVAMRKKELGIWREYTWKDYYENVKYFSLGLVSLGFERGDKLAVLGDNNPEWFWAELAAMAAGGVVTGVFVDCSPPEVRYIVDHSDSTIVVAKDQEQVDKMLQIIDQLPEVKRVIYWDHRGLRGYDHSILTSFDQVLEMGRQYEESHPGLFEENVEKGKRDDLALILYTSGTTGLPKGAMASYDYLMTSSEINLRYYPSCETDEYLSYILPGWMVEQTLGLGVGLMVARPISFPEATSTVGENFREIAPSYIMQPSMIWESIASSIRSGIEEASFLKRFLYNLFLPVGYKIAYLRFKKKKVNWYWRVLYRVADLAAFRPVRDRYGFTKVKDALTAGAALSPDMLKFFHAHGIPLRQGYGLSEAQIVAGHRHDDIRPETVGKIFPEVKVKISDEGEILVGSDRIFQGYYKDPEKYHEMVRDGWLHTGDAGYIDEEGHIIYYDRLADLMELAGGEKFAPQYIESRLKFSPRIQECLVVVGEDKSYVSALINVGFANVGRWAEKKRIPYTTYVDLSQKDEVAQLIGREIAGVNKTLPEACRVKKYVVLHKEFDPDEAELTRTKKLRRSFMEERYKDLVSAIYRDASEYTVDAEVRYRDGRTGRVRTGIKIRSVEEITG